MVAVRCEARRCPNDAESYRVINDHPYLFCFEHTETRVVGADVLVFRMLRYHRMVKSIDLSEQLRP